MKVLVIGYVWPEPASSAAGTRMMELIRLFLEQGWTVTFASPAAKGEHMADLGAIGVEACEIELNSSSFDRFIGDMSPDIVVFDRFMMEEQFGWRVEKSCPQALRVLETSDLHCLRDTRHQMAKKEQRVVLDVDPALLLDSDMALREVAAIYRSDLTLLVSEYELELLVQTFSVPGALLHFCPFMLDESALGEASSFEDRKHFVTIGNFRHAPNWDSVLWLKQEIWPLIRRVLPEAELHVYGSYTPKKAMALHAPKEGFHIRGWAEDALEVMKQARVCLAPLRFGAGIKGKLADAMVAGTPSVTTAVGAESMHGGLPWGGAIADDAGLFAQHAVNLYRHEAMWVQAQQHGYDIVRSVFGKHRNGEALVRRIGEIGATLDQHRLQNFTGAMLRHHHQRSTEFMSRWIETKNRLAGSETP